MGNKERVRYKRFRVVFVSRGGPRSQHPTHNLRDGQSTVERVRASEFYERTTEIQLTLQCIRCMIGTCIREKLRSDILCQPTEIHSSSPSIALSRTIPSVVPPGPAPQHRYDPIDWLWLARIYSTYSLPWQSNIKGPSKDARLFFEWNPIVHSGFETGSSAWYAMIRGCICANTYSDALTHDRPCQV